MMETDEALVAVDVQMDMLSDWHVGSGFGRPGDVDALVVRDIDDVPYVPGKTLTGILRDACEQAAYALDGGAKTDNWAKWVVYLFGSQPSTENIASTEQPSAAKLSIRSAHFSQHVLSVLTAATETAYLQRKAITFIKPGVQLDPDNGLAMKDCLRMEEMVRGGCTLHASGQLDVHGLTEQQRSTVLALLWAGTRLADHMGGKRRRGGGLVRMVLSISGQPELDYTASLTDHPSPPPQPTTVVRDELHIPVPAAGETHHSPDTTWQLVLRLDSPTVLPRAKKGNVVESLDYIPGTYLLSIVRNALRGVGIDADEEIRQGHLVFTNATRQIAEARGLPVPWALFEPKTASDQSKQCINVINSSLPPDTQYKGLRVGYVQWEQPKSDSDAAQRMLMRTGKVHMAMEMHNAVDDKTQRPNETGGGVYTYEALSPGQLFVADIHIRGTLATAADKAMKGLKKKTIRLGQSKKDQYGQATIVEATNLTSTADTTTVTDLGDPGSALIVWLTSDVLVRDKRLRLSGDPVDLGNLLQERLGCKLTLHTQSQGAGARSGAAPIGMVGRRHRTDSWQVSWGLPRPTLVGLCAGTCIHFDVADVQDAVRFRQTLRDIERWGIGDRVAEGFGQMLFNSPLLIQDSVTSIGERDPLPPVHMGEPNSIDEGYLAIIRRAAMTDLIRRVSAAVANNTEWRRSALGIQDDSKPSDSMMGTLRSMASAVRGNGDRLLTAWCNPHHRGNQSNEDAFAKKWGSKTTQLRDLGSNPETILTLFKEADENDYNTFRTICGAVDRPLPADVWSEAFRTLVDRCIRSEKLQRSGSEKNTTSDRGGAGNGTHN